MTGCNKNTAPSSTGASSESTSISQPDSSISSSSSSSSIAPEPETEMEGNGTKASPYLPVTAKHFLSLAEKVKSATAVYITLTKDIDLGNEEWVPFGGTGENKANVYLNGNGHSIKGLSITESNSDDKGVYGLFGMVTGVIKNLKVEGSIEITANNPTAMAGLVAGAGDNLTLRNVDASGSVKILDSKDKDNQMTYAGGLVGVYIATGYYFVSVEGSSFAGSVSSNGDYIGMAGGLIGEATTSTSSIGISALNTNYVNATKISASYLAGGLAGSSYYYFSAVNNVVVADTIETTSTLSSQAYASGIIASDYLENAVLYNIVKAKNITVGDAAAKGVAGKIVAAPTEDGYSEGSNIEGGAEYGNISIDTTLTGAYTLGDEDVALISLKADDLKAKGFVDTAWDLEDGKLPVLKENASDGLETTGQATIKAGYDGGADEKLAFTTGSFNKLESTAKRSGYNLIGSSYSPDEYISYRWYAPLNVAPTLYDNWFETAKIGGFWKGAETYNFVINIDGDGTLVAYFDDMSSAKGTWWSNGSYLVFTINYATAPYEDQVAEFQDDGTFTFPDANDSSYTYTYTKTKADYGYWADADGHLLTLNGDGTGSYSDGSSSVSVTYTVAAGVITSLTVGDYAACTPVLKDGVLSITLDDGEYPFTLSLTPSNGIPDYTGWKFL